LGDARHALCPCFRLPPSLATVSRANLYCFFRSIWRWAPHNGLPDGGLSFEALKPIAAHLASLISEAALLLALRCLVVCTLGLPIAIVLYGVKEIMSTSNMVDLHSDMDDAMDVDSTCLNLASPQQTIEYDAAGKELGAKALYAHVSPFLFY
jgi:hypothetical protein